MGATIQRYVCHMSVYNMLFTRSADRQSDVMCVATLVAGMLGGTLATLLRYPLF